MSRMVSRNQRIKDHTWILILHQIQIGIHDQGEEGRGAKDQESDQRILNDIEYQGQRRFFQKVSRTNLRISGLLTDGFCQKLGGIKVNENAPPPSNIKMHLQFKRVIFELSIKNFSAYCADDCTTSAVVM